MAVIRFFAAASAAAQTTSEVSDAATLGDLLAALAETHGPDFARVLGRCSVLVDGRQTDDPATRLAGETTVDVLPPFAGG